MNANVTDEQIRDLAATARRYSVTLLSWALARHQDGADAIELEHQRRMVALRAEGVITVLCPVVSETICGIALMTVSAEEADRIMAEDPCVRAGVMTYETYSCLGFPGDAVAADEAS